MKRTFSLTEVVIALSLSALLLSTCMGTLMRGVKLQKKLENARHIATSRALLNQRLSHLLNNSKKVSIGKNELTMTLDNGYDPDPTYRSEQEVSLIYEKGELTLTYKGKKRRERLTKYTSLSWSFSEENEWLILHLDGEEYPFFIRSDRDGVQI